MSGSQATYSGVERYLQGRHRGLVWPVLLLGLVGAGTAVGQEAADEERDGTDQKVELETVRVAAPERNMTEGSDTYAGGDSSAATGLDLTPRETPQSMSSVTHAQMEDFGLHTTNDALKQSTGVTVEEVESDRTLYTARGFEVTNFLVDGIGIPFVYHNNVVGSQDTAIYDRIEVLRGANGLMSGTGNPAASVNFVRKRPTDEPGARLGLTAGSWDKYRFDGDVDGALNDSGTLRGRLVTAHEDRESYLDRLEREQSVAYGVLEFDLTDDTTLALGHSHQVTDTDSPLWGALPLYRTDGSATDYDRHTSTSTDWAYWDNEYSNSFLELHQRLGAGWQLQATLEHRRTTSDSQLFYVYGTPDPTTPGSDLFAYPSQYEKDTRQDIADLRAKGPFELGGRMHELVAGGTYWEVDLEDESNYGQGIGTEIEPLEEWTGDYPKPPFTAGTEGSDITFRQKSAFAAARFSLADPLALLAGGRLISVDYNGESYGVSRDTRYSNETVPYAGLVYDLTDTWSIYGSHTEIFQPQTEVDINRDFLDPVDGVSQEVGFKAAFPGRELDLTLAAFEIEQNNVAEPVGAIPGSSDTFYEGREGLTSRGYEIDLQGELLNGLQVAAGFTRFNLNDRDGDRARPFVPEKVARLTTAWRPAFMERLKLGASARWQDDTRRHQGTATTGPNSGEPIHTRQDAYTLIDLMGQYDITDRVTARLNVNNVTDEKYIRSLYWADQGYYGAPRHGEISVTWEY